MNKLSRDERLAMVHFVKSLLDQLDETASLKKQGKKAEISRKILEEMTSVLPKLEPDLLELFYAYLITFSSNIQKPPSRAHSEEVAEYTVDKKRALLDQIHKALVEKAA
ncbi:MAG: hypothetical protein KDD70_17380 [Bdellovibrionales bacterium]|nr:hypothetical protein [Bdellovibrionales bacterium]